MTAGLSTRRHTRLCNRVHGERGSIRWFRFVRGLFEPSLLENKTADSAAAEPALAHILRRQPFLEQRLLSWLVILAALG